MQRITTTKATFETTPNYCLKIICANRYILLKDITGEDLELIGHVLETDTKDLEVICELLSNKLVSGNKSCVYDPRKFPIKFLYSVFKIYLAEIVAKEYIDKVSWLKGVYYMQKNSFRDITILEKLPMNQFLVMLNIHKEAVEHARDNT